ncbi:MAG: DUF99 family protein [Candidatus Caldarchaeales archaeon]
MRLSLEKKAIRVMGVAESFKKGLNQDALLVGVVMRSDLVVDGIVLGRCKVGGMDATDSIIKMYHKLERTDISAMILNGCIISWFNVIDLKRMYKEINIPLVCLTYHPSAGIRDYFIKYFPEDWIERVRVYEENGPRIEVVNKNRFKIYLRVIGVDVETALNLINKYTLFGKIPEPLRLARLIAHSVFQHGYTS